MNKDERRAAEWAASKARLKAQREAQKAAIARLYAEKCDCGHPVAQHNSKSGECLGGLTLSLSGEMSRRCPCTREA